MMPVTQALHDHHKQCDALFAQAEAAVCHERWAEGRDLLGRFRHEMEAHFATEEQLLFPALEAATGMVGGPAQMMRFEHAQMRDLLARMVAVAADSDGDAFVGTAETLLVLMQQHNMKEENILYPMCDRAVSKQEPWLSQDLRERLGTR